MAQMNYKVIRALHRAGAKLLAGTDAGNPFVFPGWSLHEELQHFVLSGLTPYQALRTATVDAAQHLGRADQSGTVGIGRHADLVLLEANPLVDIANTEKITGVMVRGRWYSINKGMNVFNLVMTAAGFKQDMIITGFHVLEKIRHHGRHILPKRRFVKNVPFTNDPDGTFAQLPGASTSPCIKIR
jgi:adenine deaminase